MIRSPLRLVAALALVALTLFVVACGGDDSGDSGSSGKTSNGSPAEGKKGGKLEQLGASDVDFLDPGQTYYTGGFQVIYATQTPLYAPKPDEEEAVPALADGEPQISDDKKSVTVKLKKGVKFGPPVNREIEAKDVKYAFERAATANVAEPVHDVLQLHRGRSRRSRASSRTSPASSSTTRTRSRSSSRKAQGVAFAAFLIMPVTTPIPKEYAEKFDKASPSTYNEHVVSSGPYMVANDAQGKLTGYKAGKSIQLVRNPNWNKDADFRPAYLDEIMLTTNATDANVAGRQVLQGQNLVLDTNPPAQVLKRVVQRQKDQLVTLPGGGFRWFPLNTHDQAAGRHQRPQGDPRRRSTVTRPSRRAAARSSASPARTSSRRASAGSRRPAARRAPGSTSSPTRRATWPSPRST